MQRVEGNQKEPNTSEQEELFELPLNSNFYRHFAREFVEKKELEKRFASLTDYLGYCYHNLGTPDVPFPPGCKSEEEALLPFWQTETVKTRNGNVVPLGSYFTLEHGQSFFNGTESTLLSHIKRHLPEKGKFTTEGQLQTIELNKIYSNLEGFLKKMAEKLENGEISLPEGAATLQEAFRPLSEREILEWFTEHGVNEQDELRQLYFEDVSSTRKAEPKTNGDSGEVLTGSPEDFQGWKTHWDWEKQNKKPVTYALPVDSTNVEVPEKVLRDFNNPEASRQAGGNLNSEDPMLDKSRWNTAREAVKDPEFQKKADYFINMVKADLISWDELLKRSHRFQHFVNYAGLDLKINTPEVFYILADKILNVEDKQASKSSLELRRKHFEQFSKYLNMGRDAIVQALQKEGKMEFSPEDAKNKTRLLRNVLNFYVTSNPLPSDIWEKKEKTGEEKLTDNQTAARKDSPLRPEDKENNTGNDWQPRNPKIFNAILDWKKDSNVLAMSGNEEDDEEAIQAGLASVKKYKQGMQAYLNKKD